MPRNLRVHIAPIGFEFRRVTEPLVRMQADKVYLLTLSPQDRAKEFYVQIKGELSLNYKHIRIEEVFIDIWDFYACVEEFREIILKEQIEGNHVYVNVSTGTKITAIAGMLSCMMWGGYPYYARTSYVTTREIEVPPTELVEEADILPVYDIKKPRPDILYVLSLLKENGGRLKKLRLIEKLESIGTIRLKDETKREFTESAKHSQLRAILDPMEIEWNYIKVEARGRRSEVFITEQGETALRIFGTQQKR